MPARERFQVVIVGAGIAGASLAYFLAERGLTDVLLLEREPQPGRHATGRSAAVLASWDPVPALQDLKLLGGAFLRDPPAGFSEQQLLHPSGILATFAEPAWSAVEPLVPLLAARGTGAQALSRDAVLARVPVLAPDAFAGGVLLPHDGHIEVHELLWSYLRHAARRGVQRRCGVAVTAVRVEDGRCRGVETDAGTVDAAWVVDAAGAWAGELAAHAGAAPIAIVPYRRTIVAFAAPDGCDVRAWPLVANESHRLYFAPDANGLFASPMDETPSPPCDAQPDEITVAETIDRLARLAPALVPRHVRRSWSGLRTFAPDRVPVVGEDPRVRGFFWLAGQGGCGIETSGALGAIAADLLVDGRTDRYDAEVLSPRRFAG